ncbi:MAG: hypothetical protein Tsb004_25470 [Allomuricauda sp.]
MEPSIIKNEKATSAEINTHIHSTFLFMERTLRHFIRWGGTGVGFSHILRFHFFELVDCCRFDVYNFKTIL